MELLEKLREINVALQKSASNNNNNNYDKMSEILSDSIKAKVLIINCRGRLLGYAENLFKSESLNQILKKRQIPEKYIDYLLRFRKINSILDMNKDHHAMEMFHLLNSRFITIIPIIGGEKRLGTMIIGKTQNPLYDEDLILAEYGATALGFQMLHLLNVEAEEETRSQMLAHNAVSTMSYSELEAIEWLLNQLNAKEGLVVTSRITEQFVTSRSIVVNALRKLKSSGLVESKSLGMKGTYVKILNNHLLTEMKKAKQSNRVYDQKISARVTVMP